MTPDPSPALSGTKAPATFGREDIRFIHRTFQMELVTLDDLTFIMRNAKLRQPLLDSRRLFDAVTEDPGGSSLSLDAYVRVRQVLLRAGVDEPQVADYLTSVVVELTENEIRLGTRPEEIPPLLMAVVVRGEAEQRDVSIQLEVGSYRVVISGCLDLTA